MKSSAASDLSLALAFEQVFRNRCTKHLCRLAFGHEAHIASPIPARPSATTASTLSGPLDSKLDRSYLWDSADSWGVIEQPMTRGGPSSAAPRARLMASFWTEPPKGNAGGVEEEGEKALGEDSF